MTHPQQLKPLQLYGPLQRPQPLQPAASTVQLTRSPQGRRLWASAQDHSSTSQKHARQLPEQLQRLQRA